MAQPDLFTNHPNSNSLYKNVRAIRTTRFNTSIPYNQSKKNNVQCTYFRSKFPKTSLDRNPIIHNKALSDCSYESESDNSANVLRWLRSLPSNFTVDDLDKNMNYCKLKEEAPQDLRLRGGNKSKSLGSSLKTTGVLFERKGILLSGNKQKVKFADRLDSTQMRSLNPKKKLMNKKRHTNSSVSRLPKKCVKSDLSSNAKSQQSSMNNNQCQGAGILKNISRKSITSTSQTNTIEKQIASNRRLLNSIKEIISSVDNEQLETAENDNKVKKNEKTISTLSNFQAPKKETKKPFLKNPEIEKKLDDAMRSTLKTYIHSNTWYDLQENNNISGDDPPVKKEKRVLPSLAPANSFPLDLGQNWNVNHVLNTLRSI